MPSVVSHLRKTTRRLSIIGALSILLTGTLASAFSVINVRTNIVNGADRVSAEVETYLAGLKADLIATAVFIGNSRDAARSLYYLGGMRPSLSYAGLYDEDGVLLAESDPSPEGLITVPAIGPRQGVEETFLHTRRDTSGNTYLDVSVPVLDFDVMTEHILYGRFSIKYLTDLTERMQVGQSGYVVIADRDRIVLAAPEEAEAEAAPERIEPYAISGTRDERRLVVRKGYLGGPVIATAVVIEPDDWIIAVEYPLMSAIGMPLLITIILVAIVAGLSSLLVSHDRFLDNRVSRPLSALDHLIAEIPDTSPAALRFPEDDEFAHLGEKYLEMSDQIDALINGLESQIRERTKELEQAQDEVIARERDVVVRRLIAGLSHEINTPLGIILTSISHLNDLISRNQSCTAEEIVPLVDLALASIDRVKKIVDRIHTSTSENIIGESSTYGWDEIFSGINMLIRAHKLKPTIHVDFSNLVLHVHLNSLLSIVDRLLENVVHHGGDKKPDMNFYLEENELALELTNHGPRVDQAIVYDLFLPFTTTERPRRVGLGLFLARNTAEGVLGGQLELIKNEDGQVCFRLAVPLDPEHP